MKPGELSIDEVFALLANRRRRYVFYCLEREDVSSTVGLDELAAQVAEWEREWDDRTNRNPSEHHEIVSIELHHNHLPRIAETPLIDYDARTRTVRHWEDSSLEDWVEDDHPEREHFRQLLETG